MKTLLWRCAAFIVSRRPVAAYLIRRAQRTPYTHITSRDGSSTYMERYWLFNGYGKDKNGDQTPARWPKLPSMRIHKILRADDDEHEHGHPWPSRSCILMHFYGEQRREEFDGVRLRKAGDTVALSIDTFHRIDYVPPQGVYTLFFTWGPSRGWGFKVDGTVVPWREYLGEPS
jgi:hypothetical protein